MKFHNIIAVSAILIVLSTGTVMAVPYTFAPGQPARAADVNANFAELEAQIQANANDIAANASDITTNATEISTNASGVAANAAGIAANAAAIAAIPVAASYDYRDYSADGSVSSKTFAITGIGSCDTEVQNFDRNTVGDTTTITRTRIRTQAGAPCRYHVHTMQSTPTGHYMLGETTYSNDGLTEGQAVTLDNPVLVRSTNMRIGLASADAATTTITNGVDTIGTYIEKTTPVGVEDVTVPYNGGTTYAGCLKVHTFRQATSGFGNQLLNRVSWFCSNIGFVKGIQSNGATWELTDVAVTP